MSKKNQVLLSDYILEFLISKKVRHVPLLIGGAISFIVDAFSRNKNIKYIAVANEQSAAMIADAYSRTGARYSCTMATSGPGATNLLTGIACSYFDSVPSMHICGQVNTYEQQGFHKSTSKVRQVGFQETDIVNMAKPITKFSYKLRKPEEIRYVLEKAYHISVSGRPGPVLIDIPMDFQRKKIIPSSLKTFLPKKNKLVSLEKKIKKLKLLISKSKKPVLILGGGLRSNEARKELNILIKKINIPIVASWSGTDLIDHKDVKYIGNIGVYGNRLANIAVQNCDLILSLGSRLDTRVTGGKPNLFAPNAKKIVVDIDKYELNKERGLKIDLKFNYNLEFFLKELNRHKLFLNNEIWLKKIKKLNSSFKFPELQNKKNKKVNPYTLVNYLSKLIDKKSIIIGDTGSHLTWLMQSFKIKYGQMLFSAFGNSPMGYALPASIGAQIVNKNKKIISFNGDGSIQLNLQELQTVKKFNLPIKIFIINNNGYGIIQQFQDLYLNKRHEASNRIVSNPDFKLISKAFKINYTLIKNNNDLNKLKKIISSKKAEIVEVSIEDKEKIIPKLEFGKPIDDLSPKINLNLVKDYLS